MESKDTWKLFNRGESVVMCSVCDRFYLSDRESDKHLCRECMQDIAEGLSNVFTSIDINDDRFIISLVDECERCLKIQKEKDGYLTATTLTLGNALSQIRHTISRKGASPQNGA